MVRVMLALATVGAASAIANPPEATQKPRAAVKPGNEQKLSQTEFRKRFFRCWLEVEKTEAGKKVTDPEEMSGMCFSVNDGWSSWGRRGELSSGHGGRQVRLDISADPVRLDVRTNLEQGFGRPDRIVVRPCIVKFDGDKLVMAWPRASVPDRRLKSGDDYAGRPKDFTSTKENGVTVLDAQAVRRLRAGLRPGR